MNHSVPDAALLADTQGIIFDCDGVMFDSMDSNRTYYNLILDRFGLPTMTPEQERFVHAHAVRECLEYIVPRERWDEIPDKQASVNYETEILPHLVPEPDLFDTLVWLRGRGVRLAMHTNRTTTVGMLTEKFGFDAYYDPIVHAGSHAPKPDPEGVHHILAAWSLSGRNVAFIGDTDVDRQTAEAGGVRFWAFRSPELAAELHLDSFTQLQELMAAARSGS